MTGTGDDQALRPRSRYGVGTIIRDTAMTYVLLHDGWHKVEKQPHYTPPSIDDEDDWFGESLFLARPPVDLAGVCDLCSTNVYHDGGHFPQPVRAHEAANPKPAETDKALALLQELAEAYRGDWSEFDGRGLRADLEHWQRVMREALANEPVDMMRHRSVLGVCPTGGGHWTEHCRDDCFLVAAVPESVRLAAGITKTEKEQQ